LEAELQTIQQMELAATDRYWEGRALMTTPGREGGGVYLLGYVAEMLLKTAYFRFDGAGQRDLVRPRLVPARNKCGVLNISLDYESYHSLHFWKELLVRFRHYRRCRLGVDLETQLNWRIRRLYRTWWVGMRYLADQAEPGDVTDVFDDVTWLRDHHSLLWR
jgi:hypothetical protein